MNIIEAEDLVKGLPDQVLFQEAQFPSGRIPQFLAVSEVQRRQDMRQRFQSQQGAQPTIKDQILQGGIASAAPPPGGEPPPMAAPQMPPQMPPQSAMPAGVATPAPPMGMANGGMTPGGIVYMQEGRTVPGYRVTPELRDRPKYPPGTVTPSGGIAYDPIRTLLPWNPDYNEVSYYPAQANLMDDFRMAEGEDPQEEPIPLEPDSGLGEAAGTISRIPEIYRSLQPLISVPAAPTEAELNRLRPPDMDKSFAARRDALVAELKGQGEARRQEDMATAQRYLKESLAPIQQSQEEARKAAIYSTLMRLGSGVAAGDPSLGLRSATEGVENIMGRAREAAAMERRAAQQEFRQAERAATQQGRQSADAVRQLQFANITADEGAQREFQRDARQFEQWAYGQRRAAGESQAQAKNKALELSIGISQTVDQTMREALRNQRISENQYTETFGTVFKEVLQRISNASWGKDEDDNDIQPTPQQLMATAVAMTKESLGSVGIAAPSDVIQVATQSELARLPSGARYRGPDGIDRIKP